MTRYFFKRLGFYLGIMALLLLAVAAMIATVYGMQAWGLPFAAALVFAAWFAVCVGMAWGDAAERKRRGQR